MIIPLAWDVTVVCTCAKSYMEASARQARAAADSAAARKA